MKKILVFLSFILCGAIAFAKAEKTSSRLPAAIPDFKELSSDVSWTLTVLWDTCPEKLADLMVDANAIGKVWYGTKEPETGAKESTFRSWRITSVYRTPPPSFDEKTVATLKIDWVAPYKAGRRMDASPVWQKTCSVEKN